MQLGRNPFESAEAVYISGNNVWPPRSQTSDLLMQNRRQYPQVPFRDA